MLDKVFKKISAKRLKGAKLIQIVGIFSVLIWMAALAAFLLLKSGKPIGAEGFGHAVTKAASAQSGSADALESVTTTSDTEAKSEADSRAQTSAGGERAGEGQAEAKASSPGNADAGETGENAAAAASDMESPEAGPTPSREELAALRQVAELRIAAGDMEKAVTPMRRVLRVPTSDPNLLSQATDVFLATGNYKEALAAALQVLSLRPDDMRVKVQAVEAQYRLGQVGKAMAAAAATVKDHPGELAMLVALGTMEVEMGPGFPGYGKSLQAALKLKPDYAPALSLLGRKAQLEGDYKDAETAFRKVIKLEPDNAKAHGQLGMAYYHLGKEKEAEKEYRAELSMNPGDYNTWFNLGELQMTYASRELNPAMIQSLRGQAMEAYLKALELNPDHAQAHYRVGVLLNGNGQYKEAIRHLEASLKLDSRHVPTLVQLSLAFENLKQPERARAYLTKAYELDPLNKVVLFKLKPWS